MKRGVINRRGFTLIELILVLAILAIIAAIAVPRFVGMQEKAKKRVLETNCSYFKDLIILKEQNFSNDKRFMGSLGDKKELYLSGCLEEYLEEISERKYKNFDRYTNPYSENKNIVNFENLTVYLKSYSDENIDKADYSKPALFITNDIRGKHVNFNSDLNESQREDLIGTIIIYMDNEGSPINIYYIDKNAKASENCLVLK